MKIKKMEKTDKIDQTPLNAFLSRAGIGSRRAVIDLIDKGHVTVNGEIIKEPGYKVKIDDVVKFKDKIIREEKKIYILLNKPAGYVTTVSDERGRKTVMELIKPAPKERLYPVGRLDRDTTGLLVITNDGYLSQQLAHPKNKVTKTYYVVLNKDLQFADMQKIRAGLFLDDGRATVDKIYHPRGKDRNHVMVDIHGGKNRIIKRIFAHVGYRVTGLDRINFAGLTKRGLLVGRWRFLTDQEIEKLENFSK